MKMGIRWFKNGKFEEAPNKEKNTETFTFQVGDYVKSIGKSEVSYWYDHSGDGNISDVGRKGHWNQIHAVEGKILDIQIISTDDYVGEIMKVETYWPWFKVNNFEIDKNPKRRFENNNNNMKENDKLIQNYDKYIKELLSFQGGMKVDGVTYQRVINADGKSVYVSNVGFLGLNECIIDWDTIIKYYKEVFKK